MNRSIHPIHRFRAMDECLHLHGDVEFERRFKDEIEAMSPAQKQALWWYSQGRRDQRDEADQVKRLERLWQDPWYVRCWNALWLPQLSRPGKVVATLLALGLLFLAGLGEGGSPPQMSVDVARAAE